MWQERLFLCVPILLAACVCRDRQPSVALAKAPGPSAEWLAGQLPPELHPANAVQGGTLVVRLYNEPNGLNRLHDQYQDAAMIRSLHGSVLETLLEIDRDPDAQYKLRPLLAESYEVSPDFLVNTFHLRKGVRFHNGEPFTSRDVKAVVETVMNPKNATTAMRAYFTDLQSYAAPDEYTFILRWKKPYYFGMRHFATLLPMFPTTSLAGDFETLAIHQAPIGTGPFKFVSWEAGRSINLVRFPDYWGPQAHLDGIVYRIVKDQTVASQMFERDEFDLMTQIPPGLWRALEAAKAENDWAHIKYNRIKFDEYNYSWIGWNLERPFFKDRRVRTALGMLFPYDQVFNNIDLGLETPTTCPFYIHSKYCDPQVKRLAHNPERARKLLAEAGWIDRNGDGIIDKDDVPFKVTFLITTHSVRLGKIAPLLKEEYRKAGIDMEIEKLEWPAFTLRLRHRDFDMAQLLWSYPDVEQDLFQTFHSSQRSSSNFGSYASPEVDNLILKIREEFDSQKRVELSQKLHRLVYEDQAYNFISVRPILDAAKKRVHGLKPGINWYDFRRVWMEPTPQAMGGSP